MVLNVLIHSELKFVILHKMLSMFWSFSLVLTQSSMGSERVGLLHVSTTIKCYNEFQGHKITEFLRLERASEDCIFLSSCYSRLVWARFSQSVIILVNTWLFPIYRDSFVSVAVFNSFSIYFLIYKIMTVKCNDLATKTKIFEYFM